MLSAKKPSEALEIVLSAYKGVMPFESIRINEALGRVLACAVEAEEYVPDFDRSAVDGYAVIASDTFGCGESAPAMLKFKGEAEIGKKPFVVISKGECVYVPTGGEIPQGADAMVMIEYAEDYGDGYKYIIKPSAPGTHVVYRGDDVKPGKKVLEEGKVLRPQDIGVLAALGKEDIQVRKKPAIGIISTGDELVKISDKPSGGQVRDINSYTIFAGIQSCGAEPVMYGICPDDYETLKETIKKAALECNMVLISGGSSVGIKDSTYRIVDELSDNGALIHGIAIKPGKPTIFGIIKGNPVFGLPGHPASAYFIFSLFVKPLILAMMGVKEHINKTVRAALTANIPSNHGREEYISVRIVPGEDKLLAEPLFGKSGMITVLSDADGYVRIGRDCEGLPADTQVDVLLL